ncbi:MAG: M28 family peptidase [Gemmatimonadetes bacterium]|nr:M28 family peptidase [Gemmatimonadota bacterium]
MNRPNLTVALALALFASPLSAQTDQSVAKAVSTITPEEIIRRIGVIAHDSMRGRATPSPELEKVATFIGGEFRKFGLKPGGDSGRFIQRYPLHRIQLDTVASTVVVSGGPSFRIPGEATPVGAADIETSGKVVIVTGSAIDATSARQLELGGTIVVLLLSPEDPTGRNNPLVRGLTAINAQHPAATVLVTPVADQAWRVLSTNALAARVIPAWQADGGPSGQLRPPLILVREAAIRAALERRGANIAALRQTTGPAQRTPMDLTMSIALKLQTGATLSAPNAVGILEGSDPVLKNEYVVFSGHMDHVGVGTPDATGDSIFNGADDDASGTIAVVQLAQAFSKLTPRPKRSLIFLTVSGEERGLWGSEYFSLHPPVEMSQVIADLNTDMVGRNWKDTIVAIGKEHSDLGATLNRVNAAHPELNMTAIDDIWPEEHFYQRSDHYNFAQKGVPILFFFNGTHPDYHGRGDEVSKIDGEKESRIVKLVFYLGLDLANAAEKPKWNPESYKSIVQPPQP